jgi:hypothetical protein
MSQSYFLIHGPIESEAPSYWSVVFNDWIDTLSFASKFPRDILTLPLPEGTEGIMEYDPQGLFLNWFTHTPPPWGWQLNSQNNN